MIKKIIFLLVVFTFSVLVQAQIGAPNDPKIGGGYFYINESGGDDVYTTGDYIVNNVSALKTALVNADADEVIFIPGSAVLDLSGLEAELVIPGGVTLASDRGVNGSKGALLKMPVAKSFPAITVYEDDVRISGFRLKGPNEFIQTGAQTIGIKSVGSDNLEIGNMELFNWGFAAVRFNGGSTNGRVHHSSLHHNYLISYGYGVVLYGNAQVLIDHNIFTANRHSIAGNGDSGQEYEAHSNIVFGYATSHGFDMHHATNGSGIAGRRVNIHNNTFLIRAPAVVIRGYPEIGAFIADNKFIHAQENDAIRQKIGNKYEYPYKDNEGNSLFEVSGNLYSQSGDMTYADLDNVSGSGKFKNNDIFWALKPDSQSENRDWYVSYNGIEPWKLLNSSMTPGSTQQIAVGDFDANGKADVFTTSSGEWLWSKDGEAPFAFLNDSGYQIATLDFGDMDGDGKTDVIHLPNGDISFGGNSAWNNSFFHTSVKTLAQHWVVDLGDDGQDDIITINAGKLQVSWGGTTAFVDIDNRPFIRAGIAYGDFNGDGKIDEFTISGGQWQIKYHDSPSPVIVNQALVNSLSEIALGDFDGDGKTDIFWVDNGRWKYSSAAIAGPVNLQSSTLPLNTFAFGDFDGDGYTDVFRKESSNLWKISWRGSSPWADLTGSVEDFSELVFADFNKDGQTDIGYVDDNKLEVSFGGSQAWFMFE